VKKSKNKPRGKRPNPGALIGSEIERFAARSMGPMILAQAIPDATLSEMMVLSVFLPTALKLLRSAGKDAAENALDKLFPQGGEIFPGIRLEPLEPSRTANGADSSRERPAGGKENA
jgi:hypothetical protein